MALASCKMLNYHSFHTYFTSSLLIHFKPLTGLQGATVSVGKSGKSAKCM